MTSKILKLFMGQNVLITSFSRKRRYLSIS
ncbi:hypothetical protein SAEN111111_25490 [Saccharibacillus endophyticus]